MSNSTTCRNCNSEGTAVIDRHGNRIQCLKCGSQFWMGKWLDRKEWDRMMELQDTLDAFAHDASQGVLLKNIRERFLRTGFSTVAADTLTRVVEIRANSLAAYSVR